MAHSGLATLREEAEKNRDNPKLVEEYANALFQAGKIILARRTLQNLYKRLHKAKRHVEASKIIDNYGSWVAGKEEDLRPVSTGPFLPLESNVGKGWIGRKQKIELHEGEMLFRAGEPADKIYLVIDGELAISVNSELTGPTLINLACRGDIVGESASQPNPVRTTDVFATKYSRLLEFDRQELENELSAHPELQELLKEEASMRRKIVALSHCQAFALLTLSERSIVAEQAAEKEIPAGTVIKQEDEQLPYAALVISGEMNSMFTEGGIEHYCGRLCTNNLFGLSKLYLDIPSPYKLIAKDNVRLLTIPHSVLTDASQAHASFGAFVAGIVRMSALQSSETIRTLSPNRMAV